MAAAPTWNVEELAPGDPTLVRLGIDWGDGTHAKPVELSVPAIIVEQGAEAVVGYFLASCEGRYELRKGLELPYNITFS